MVVLRGNVIDAKKTNAYRVSYVQGAVVSQGSGWSVVTDTSGSFYTSANTTLDQLTMNSSGYNPVTIDIPVFSTHYDGNVVISGSLTSSEVVSGYFATIVDTGKIFIPGALSGRILTMMNGLDDGDTAVIAGNTVNTITIGGVSGGSIISGSNTPGTVLISGLQVVAVSGYPGVFGLSGNVFFISEDYTYNSMGSITSANTSGIVNQDIVYSNTSSTTQVVSGGGGRVTFVTTMGIGIMSGRGVLLYGWQ